MRKQLTPQKKNADKLKRMMENQPSMCKSGAIVPGEANRSQYGKSFQRIKQLPKGQLRPKRSIHYGVKK